MAKSYTKEEFWKLYNILPQELQDVIFSEETGNSIYGVCERNGIIKKINMVVDSVGEVLLGILPPEHLQIKLKGELGIDLETAKNVAREIDRLIFRSVRPFLEKIYSSDVETAKKLKDIPETKNKIEQEATEPNKKDAYRESF